MKYIIKEVEHESYTSDEYKSCTYFWKRGFEAVFHIKHGDICAAKPIKDYGNFLCLLNFQYGKELPKYIKSKI